MINKLVYLNIEKNWKIPTEKNLNLKQAGLFEIAHNDIFKDNFSKSKHINF